MECANVGECIGSYLDNELELARSVEIEKHLCNCADCRRACEQASAMRSALRQHAAYFAAPDQLRSDIRSTLRSRAKPAARASRLPWLNFGAALAIAFVVTWGLASYWPAQNSAERLPQEIVAGHVRSLQADHLADVASSDRHTVKPWFSGKLDFSPTVQDLAAKGFPLLGGRLDYIESRPVAALVYRHRQHVINLFMWPAETDENAPPKALSRQGYQLVNWTASGMVYCAVSDIRSAELKEFARIFSANETTGGAGGDSSSQGTFD